MPPLPLDPPLPVGFAIHDTLFPNIMPIRYALKIHLTLPHVQPNVDLIALIYEVLTVRLKFALKVTHSLRKTPTSTDSRL